MTTKIPQHLQRYCVEQNYARYTPIDQSAWRYILRQLRAYLSKHAHPDYLDGLKKTGISVEKIPSIEEISQKLEEFGWRAVPVSGFIPPAAFMEMQAYGILPIASDMRSVDHLLYTPAPDIVHEAAGHAPFLATPEYAAYLKRYAQVAKKAIISSEDMAQYEAIRELSDLKESSDATEEQIKSIEEHLATVTKNMSHVSEAAQLGRMNWWTAEYGLIGDISSPKIYGAGLLSSVGESRECLSSKVKKIPLTLECVQQTYDITEPQPQLFVTSDFAHLNQVLDEFADTMAFKKGGTEGLNRAIEAKTVNSVMLSSGIQFSGVVDQFLSGEKEDDIAYVKLQGESQLSYKDEELTGHSRSYHKEGFGTPVGRWVQFPDICPARLSADQLKEMGLTIGETAHLTYTSGFKAKGRLRSLLNIDGVNLVLSLEEATATFKGKVLFQPGWGVFDIALGDQVTSVFGGPADREAYGEYEDFVAARVPKKQFSKMELLKHSLYSRVRELRQNQVNGKALEEAMEPLLKEMNQHFPNDWLLPLELYELSFKLDESHPLAKGLLKKLEELAHQSEKLSVPIHDGLVLASHP